MDALDAQRGREIGRRCATCGAPLAADNTASACSKCHREQRDQLAKPPVLDNQFFDTEDFRAAFASWEIGRVFLVYRNHPYHVRRFGKPLSQDLLGQWLGLNQAQISRYERGRPELNLEVLRRYAETLHLPQHMLWFDLPGSSRLTAPTQKSASSLPAVHGSPNDAATSNSVLNTFGLITLGQSNISPGRLSVATHREVAPMRSELLGHYESLTASYRKIDYQAGAQAVYAETVNHLNRLLSVADEVPSALYGRYVALLGDTAQLAAWLAIDGQDYATARHFCSVALSSAEEAEDPTSHSYVLGVMSYIHLHAQRGKEAIRLLDSALRIANTPRFGVNPAVRSWLYEALAEAHAFAGNRESSIKALAESERIFNTVDVTEVPEWLGFYNSSDHATRLMGRGLVRLGDSRAAIETLQSACESLPDHYVREKSGTLIDLAGAYLLEPRPEPEAAASTAEEAWRLAVLTNSGRNQRRIRELLSTFEPYANLDSVQSLVNKVR